MTRFPRIVLLTILAGILPAQVGRCRETGRISIENGQIVLKNSLGCKLVFHRHEDGKYGLGTFYLNNKRLGGTVTTFLNEDNHYIWDEYQAAKYEIVEDSPERSVIKFSGAAGGGTQLRKFSVTITLPDKIPAYSLDYEVGTTAFAYPKHPLYVSVPFNNQAMEFVQYPMETLVTAPFNGQWYITPHLSKVPLMFGCEKIGGQDAFVGVGYRLTGQDYTQGRLQYDTWKPEVPFKVFFPLRWFIEPRWHAGPYHMHMIVSTATTQSDCIEGYMNLSGYDLTSPVRRTIDDSISAAMRGYKNVPLKEVYDPGKGYRMIAWASADKAGQYYAHVDLGRNIQLAYQLYKYWESHPQETWAKSRAIEMADFYVASQEADGAIPLLWDTKESRYRTYYPPIEAKGCIYGTMEMSLGAYNLHRLYLERKSFEKIDCEPWKRTAIKAIDYIAGKVGPDGSLGRSFSKKGQYDDVYANGWVMIALDYFHEKTGGEKYRQAMERAERWISARSIRTNNYYNTAVDANAWRPEGTQFQNHDTQTQGNFATYYAYRHMKTKDPRYLQLAKDVVFYDWLSRMPVEMPGYKHATRGLAQEQDIWPTFDAPWQTETRDCLPYLSAVTGDKFYAAWYKILLQTQMGYQAADKTYPFNYIGLHPHRDREGPEDRLAEGDGVWITFTSFFLEDLINTKASRRYIGGRDWGVGLDYDPGFTPNSGPAEPYVICASSAVTSASWNSQKKELATALNGKVGEQGTMTIKWDSKRWPLAGMAVTVDGGHGIVTGKHFEAADEILAVDYTCNKPSLTLRISTVDHGTDR